MPRAVLFVDDSPLARARVARALRDHGVPVTTLASSREAEGLDATTFAAALLDIELGDGTGPELAAALRKTAPELPIAFLTGGAAEPVLAQARAIGAVFSKSSDVDEALTWLRDRATG